MDYRREPVRADGSVATLGCTGIIIVVWRTGESTDCSAESIIEFCTMWYASRRARYSSSRR
jgi:hypothetical protein